MPGLSVRAGGMWNQTAGKNSAVAVIVSVTQADGSPVTGLTAANFGMYIVDDPSAQPKQPVGQMPFEELPAPPSGLYALGTNNPGSTFGGQWGSDELVILVEVESGNDRGRAMLNVIF